MDYEKTKRLVHLAMRFWTNAESPSDDDWETVFFHLAERNADELERFMKASNIDTEN
jgi:hypothetical protein